MRLTARPVDAARRLALVAAAALTVGTLAACDDTIRGIGRDIRDTGQAIEDATS